MSGGFMYLLLVATVLVGPVDIARAHFEAGEYSKAILMLSDAHRVEPTDAAINHWLARSYYEKHDYELAIAYGAKAERSHSLFLARKVKKAFETAVKVGPLNIGARRDLMQYLLEAPGIIGGDKEKAKQQAEFIAMLDPIEGRLAWAAFFSAEKKWKEAEAEYVTALNQNPNTIESYMEAAEFFADRKDADNLDRVLAGAARLDAHDPRLAFYRAVVLILRRVQLPAAEALLRSYVNKVPERSDYPSHKAALAWLRTSRT